jgi:hypothetical protein
MTEHLASRLCVSGVALVERSPAEKPLRSQCSKNLSDAVAYLPYSNGMRAMSVNRGTRYLLLHKQCRFERIDLQPYRFAVTDAVIETISRRHSNILEHLSLRGCWKLTDQCLEYLLTCCRLQYLDLRVHPSGFQRWLAPAPRVYAICSQLRTLTRLDYLVPGMHAAKELLQLSALVPGLGRCATCNTGGLTCDACHNVTCRNCNPTLAEDECSECKKLPCQHCELSPHRPCSDEDCEQQLCPSCATVCTCKCCNLMLCCLGDHDTTTQCDRCTKTACEECDYADRCQACNGICCYECSDKERETCSVCKIMCCDHCTVECAPCGTKFCSDCSGMRPCGTCSIQMCGSCSVDHTCCAQCHTTFKDEDNDDERDQVSR